MFTKPLRDLRSCIVHIGPPRRAPHASAPQYDHVLAYCSVVCGGNTGCGRPTTASHASASGAAGTPARAATVRRHNGDAAALPTPLPLPSVSTCTDGSGLGRSSRHSDYQYSCQHALSAICAWLGNCKCACAHSCMCAYVHVCMCACVHVCMCACVHVCMCACVHVCMCACVHVFMCACVHVCM